MKLSKKYFTFHSSLNLSPSWVSNGHFAVKRTTVDNVALFATEATALATVGKGVRFIERDTDDVFQSWIDATRTAWYVTDFLYESAGKTCRVVQSDTGVIALIDRDYCDLLAIGAGHTIFNGKVDGSGPFADGDTGEDLTWILMPAGGSKECQSALDRMTAQPVTLAQAG
jgi:hypothetical protein